MLPAIVIFSSPVLLLGLVMVRSGCLCMVSCVLLMVPESLRAGQCFSTVLEMKVKDGDGDGDGEQAFGRHLGGCLAGVPAGI